MLKIEGIDITTSVSGRITCEGTMEGFGDFQIVDGVIFDPEGEAQQKTLINNLKAIVKKEGYLIDKSDEMYHLVTEGEAIETPDEPSDVEDVKESVREGLGSVVDAVQVDPEDVEYEDPKSPADEAAKQAERAEEAANYSSKSADHASKSADHAGEAANFSGRAANKAEAAARHSGGKAVEARVAAVHSVKAAEYSRKAAKYTGAKAVEAGGSAMAAKEAVDEAKAAAGEAAENFKKQTIGFNQAWAKYAMGELHKFLKGADHSLRKTAVELKTVIEQAGLDNLVDMVREAAEIKEAFEDQRAAAQEELEALYQDTKDVLEGTEDLLDETLEKIKEMEEKAEEANQNQAANGGVVVNVGSGANVPSDVLAAINESSEKMAQAVMAATEAATNATSDAIKSFGDILTAMRDERKSERAEDKAEFKKQFDAIEKARVDAEAAKEAAEQRLQELQDQIAKDEAEKARLAKEKKEKKGSLLSKAWTTTKVLGAGTLMATAGLTYMGGRRLVRGVANAPRALASGVSTTIGSAFQLPLTFLSRTFNTSAALGRAGSNLIPPAEDWKNHSGTWTGTRKRWITGPAQTLARGTLGFVGGVGGLVGGAAVGAVESPLENILSLRLSYGPGEDPQTKDKNRLRFNLLKDRGVYGLGDTAWNGWWVPTMNVGATSLMFSDRNKRAEAKAAGKPLPPATLLGSIKKPFVGLWNFMKKINGSDVDRLSKAAINIDYQSAKEKVLKANPEWRGKLRYAPLLFATSIWAQETDKFEEFISAGVDFSNLENEAPGLAFLGKFTAAGQKMTSPKKLETKEKNTPVHYDKLGSQLLVIKESKDLDLLKGFLKSFKTSEFEKKFGPYIKNVKDIISGTHARDKSGLQSATAALFGGERGQIHSDDMEDNFAYLEEFLDSSKYKGQLDNVQKRKMDRLLAKLKDAYSTLQPLHSEIFPKKKAA